MSKTHKTPKLNNFREWNSPVIRDGEYGGGAGGPEIAPQDLSPKEEDE